MKKISALLLILFIFSSKNSACDCVVYDGKSIKEVAEEFDEIFLGKLKTPIDSILCDDPFTPEGFITKGFVFEVLEKWKGSSDQSIQIKHYAMCGNFYPEEKEWIILVSKDGDRIFSTTGCSPLFANNKKEKFKEIEKSLNELFPNKVFSKTDEHSNKQRFLVLLFIIIAFIFGLAFGKIKIKQK